MADMASTLLRIWHDVFGVPVGVTDNFFDLGGDSFAALRACT
jgi:hypothetical protein